MFFFFKQKTAYEMRISDWSSDVCSSDLKSRQQTNRHCDGRDKSCSHTAEEQENHQHDQHRGLSERMIDFIDRATDEFRLIRADGNRPSRRESRTHFLGQSFCPIGNLPRIGPGLANYTKANPIFALGPKPLICTLRTLT